MTNKKRILIIDDDIASLELLSRRLEASGYESIVSSNGKAGLALAQNHRPDLIIMDVLLPGMDGFQLCEKIKTDPALASIPIMMLTAVYVDEADKDKGLRVGAERYLMKADIYMFKPFHADRLLYNVGVLLKERQPEETHREKILVIDDEPDTLGLLKATLAAGGYEVITALSGEEGLRKVKLEKPDLVLLDIQMPGVSGIEVLTKIKEERPQTAVVMITAYGSEKIAVESMRKGANDYISKAIDGEELIIRVRENLEASKLRGRTERLMAMLKESNVKLMRQYEDLEKARDYADNIIKSMTDPLIVADADTKIKIVNQAVVKLLGYREDELVGKPVEAVFAENYSKETIPAALTGEGELLRNYETYYKAKDGKKIPVLFSSSLIKDKRGNIISIVYAARDITERKRAEEALRVGEAKHRMLLESLPQKIFFKDRNSVYVSCNENYARDLNIKPEEIAGRTDYEFYPKELAEKYRADDRRIMEAGGTEEIEEKYIQHGNEISVHTVKTTVKDEQGNAIGILGIFWDITERRRAEEEIKSLARFPSENPNPVYRISKGGKLLYANKAGLCLLECKKCFIDNNYVADSWLKVITEALVSKSEKEFELESNNIFYSFVVAPAVEEGYVNLYGIDITERKKVEEEQKKLIEDLEETNKIMVGRELMMVELKKEVNKLSKELGRPEPYDWFS